MPQIALPTLDDDLLLKKALESLLFISDKPVTLSKLCDATGVDDEARVSFLVGQIKSEMEGPESPWQVMEVAEGYQMATKPSFAPFVRKLFAERMTMRLSRAAHETLAIIAYRQPMTRAEIEAVRGVDVIAALETLLEKGLVKVVGRRESVGRPLMYGTTIDFLRHFGLKSLEELPPIDQFAIAAAEAVLSEQAAPAAEAPLIPPIAQEAPANAETTFAASGPAEPMAEAQSPVVDAGEPQALSAEAASVQAAANDPVAQDAAVPAEPAPVEAPSSSDSSESKVWPE